MTVDQCVSSSSSVIIEQSLTSRLQNKYTATANSLMFIGNQLDVPTYTLYQREREDAPDPLSMFWYNPETQGDWWNGLALDHSFDDRE